jgi:hypothetical protein
MGKRGIRDNKDGRDGKDIGETNAALSREFSCP